MRRLCAAATCLIWLLAAGAAGAKTGRLAVVGGIRRNSGALGDRYSFGALYGAEASFHPSRGMLGLAWWLIWGRYTSSGHPDNVEDELFTAQMGLGLRLRVPLATRAPLFGVLQLGGELVRTSIPVPPDASRHYFGPTGGLGLELASGSLSVAATGQYGLFATGPAGLSFMIALGLSGD